ncbi:glycosyltransferase, partial [Kineococcus glutinatus]|uniref:glycosyltransferase n=1 Tax=Kineococcus glutinatus TaxID=1070872 RepID=UPI0031EBBD1D
GYWDDDFGAARNRALQHCTGEWVFCVDADEVPVGDAGALRRALVGTGADVLAVAQVSDVAGGSGRQLGCLLPRVLRRSRCGWEGALHEQVVAHHGPTRVDTLGDVVLRHSGHDPARRAARGKAARNLAVAEAALARVRAGAAGDLQVHLVAVARSACEAGEHRRALDVLAEVDLEQVGAHHGTLAAHSAVEAALAAGEHDLAHRWLGAARTWGETPAVCRGLEAQVALAAG